MTNNPFEVIDARLSNIEALLLDLKHGPIRQVIDDDPLMTIRELADYLPEKPAIQTIYQWVNARKIEYEKHGKALWFRKSKVDKWLRNGRQIIPDPLITRKSRV